MGIFFGSVKTMARPTPFERHGKILRGLLEDLPSSHKGSLDDFLEECTLEELRLIKMRLHDMPEDRFPVLITTLANASTDKFYSYLGLFFAAPSYLPYSSGLYFGQVDETGGSVDDPDEGIGDTESATVTEQAPNLVDDAHKILEDSEKDEPNGNAGRGNNHASFSGSGVSYCEHDAIY